MKLFILSIFLLLILSNCKWEVDLKDLDLKGEQNNLYMIRKATLKNNPTKEYSVKTISNKSLSLQQEQDIANERFILSKVNNIPNNNVTKLKGFKSTIFFRYFIFDKYDSDLEIYLIKINSSLKSKYSLYSVIEKLAFNCLSALKELHKRRIVHRDIRPQNIYVKVKEGIPTFAIANFEKSIISTEENMINTADSSLYIAPEVLARKVTNTNVDIWSLGVVLYEVMRGKHPFFLAEAEEDIINIFDNGRAEGTLFSENELQYFKKTPVKLVEMVEKYMMVDAKDRLSALQLLEKYFPNKLEKLKKNENVIINDSEELNFE